MGKVPIFFAWIDRFLNVDKSSVMMSCEMMRWTDGSLYRRWVIDERTGPSEFVSYLCGELSWQLLKEMKDAEWSWCYSQPVRHMEQLQRSSVHPSGCIQKRWRACWAGLCGLYLYDIILAHARKLKWSSLATLKNILICERRHLDVLNNTTKSFSFILSDTANHFN